MDNDSSLRATDPSLSATVSASAGCGKTWLLVTRIIRLLLAGAEPGSILALTFTRKAAGEMSLRLTERLYSMACADDEQLRSQLEMIEADTDSLTMQRARTAYEQLLFSLESIHIQTFHSFCQDVLARFPVEAGVPPGFDLSEDTSLLQQRAWERLFSDATLHPDSATSRSFGNLIARFNSTSTIKEVLFRFLEHRSDWWAFTEDSDTPVDDAVNSLLTLMEVSLDETPIEDYIDERVLNDIGDFARILGRNGKKEGELADAIATALADGEQTEIFDALHTAVFTQKGDPRARRSNPTQAKRLGTKDEDRLLELHGRFCEELPPVVDKTKRIAIVQMNADWYAVGCALVDRYEQIKQELRVLDFADLEWFSYRLLNTSDHAEWVQYKTDQRLDHFLIDEFQDTNPTQWQLLKPLIEEIAANPGERWRTVFIVGDPKQSIYGFRRANPELQAAASKWLQDHLSAVEVPLDASRRSSPAIIDLVNETFTLPEITAQYPRFKHHETHQRDLPGQVEVIPLFSEEELATNEELHALRNPLIDPRETAENRADEEEAEFVANYIRKAYDENLAINIADGTRAIRYSDIMILMRKRSRTRTFEEALKRCRIPFISNQKGSFLANIEILDLECLIETLVTPYDNLALAQVLKCPIFAVEDEDLIIIAEVQHSGPWYERLAMAVASRPDRELLVRSHRLLEHWRSLADTIPVHDLLDRIYCEADLVNRYLDVAPEMKRSQIRANLDRFMSLALEINSGRYPSLTRFLSQLRELRIASESIDEPSTAGEDCVRIMTIHASKGLEAPMVFLVDSATGTRKEEAHVPIVDWGVDEDRPGNIYLLPRKNDRDDRTNTLLSKKNEDRKIEDLNLLYVAITRARQFLIVTGTAPKISTVHWHQTLSSAFDRLVEEGSSTRYHRYGSPYSDRPERRPPPETSPPEIDEGLKRPIPLDDVRYGLLKPSEQVHETEEQQGSADRDRAMLRGTIIHRGFELSSSNTDPASLRKQLRGEHPDADDELIDSCVEELLENLNCPGLELVFQPEADAQVFDELPILYRGSTADVYGYIDRLIINRDEIILVDYKSNRIDDIDECEAKALDFRPQLMLYRDGVQKLWSDRPIRTGILFTDVRQIVWID